MSELAEQEPFLIRKKQAVKMFGNSESLVDSMLKAGWFAPVVRIHRLTLFDMKDLKRAHQRLCDGELPSRHKLN